MSKTQLCLLPGPTLQPVQIDTSRQAMQKRASDGEKYSVEKEAEEGDREDVEQGASIGGKKVTFEQKPKRVERPGQGTI